ncbi:hypothetical protein BDV97DRAFT_67013 [Delphinella strobiligena]|nr:hypothetical protein BDV97DRAFT_67013 [Delphinella strobiligena]
MRRSFKRSVKIREISCENPHQSASPYFFQPHSQVKMGHKPGTAIRKDSASTQSRIPLLKNSKHSRPGSTSNFKSVERVGNRLFLQPLNTRHKATNNSISSRSRSECCSPPRKKRKLYPTSETSTEKLTMSYEIPHSHVAAPCTDNSLTHRLSCGHLVLTVQPTNECGGNCGNASAAFALRLLPPNPRNLDTAFICPAECALDPEVFPAEKQKRMSVQLCQLIPESVYEDVERERRSVDVNNYEPPPYQRKPSLAGPGLKRVPTDMSYEDTPPSPESDIGSPTTQDGNITPSMQRRQRMSLIMAKKPRDSAISGFSDASRRSSSRQSRTFSGHSALQEFRLSLLSTMKE